MIGDPEKKEDSDTEQFMRKTREESKGSETLTRTNFERSLEKSFWNTEDSADYGSAIISVIYEEMKSGDRKKLVKFIKPMWNVYEKLKKIQRPTHRLGMLLGYCLSLESIAFSEYGPERLSESVKDPQIKEQMIAAEELAEKDVRSCLEKSMFQISKPYEINPNIKSNKMVNVSLEDSGKRTSYLMATLGLIRKYIRTGNMVKLKEIENIMDEVYIDTLGKLADFEEKVNYKIPDFSFGIISGISQLLTSFVPDNPDRYSTKDYTH